MQSIFLAAVLALGATFPALTSALKDINTIPLSTRQGWCTSQTAQCPALCALKDSTPSTNECYAENLYYSCVCTDGSRPDLTEVSETIPYYLCVLDSEDCVHDCGLIDNACSSQCRKTFVCGASSPTAFNSTATSSSASKTGTKASTPASTSPSTKVDSNGFAVVDSGDNTDDSGTTTGTNSAAEGVALPYGMGFVAAGLALGAALMGL